MYFQIMFSFHCSCSVTRGKAVDRIPLPPPHYGSASLSTSKPSRASSFRPSAPSRQQDQNVSNRRAPTAPAASASASASDNHVIALFLLL